MWFANTYKFCDGDINKFCWMIRKGVYPYVNMDSWKRFNETLSDKKEWLTMTNYSDYLIVQCLERQGRTLKSIETLDF